MICMIVRLLTVTSLSTQTIIRDQIIEQTSLAPFINRKRTKVYLDLQKAKAYDVQLFS